MEWLKGRSLVLLEGKILVLVQQVRSPPLYDFEFSPIFETRSVTRLSPQTVVARIGAIADYARLYSDLAEAGLSLINDPHEYARASELPSWYPTIPSLTPRSEWYSEPPDVDLVATRFGWPVFIKGARQTSKHQADLAIAKDADDYARLVAGFRKDPILHWQHFVCREYIPLRRVGEGFPGVIPPAMEFRTFWFRNTLVAAGRYWTDVPDYDWTAEEREAALEVAEEAVRSLDVPFIVVDLAQTESGRWIVIECNDAQESGYAGCSPIQLWRNLLDA